MTQCKRIGLVLFVLVAVGIVSLHSVAVAQQPQAGKVYKLRMESIYTPGETGFKGTLTNFIKRVKAMSGGRIEIELFSGGTLVPSADITASVGKGSIDMGSASAAYIAGMEPVAYTTLIPQGPRNAEDCLMIWKKGLGDLMSAAYERQGVKLLGMMIVSDMPLYSRKPVRTLADFKGLKIRTHSAMALFTEQLGASNVFIPGGEVYMALSNGTVDAATWGNYSTIVDKKWYEPAKYVILPQIIYMFQNDDITMNKEIFDKLPDDLKAILVSAANNAAWELAEGNMLANDEAWKVMRAAGVQVLTLPPADVAKMGEAAKKVWDTLASRGKDAYAGMKITTDYLRSKGYTDYDITKRSIRVK